MAQEKNGITKKFSNKFKKYKVEFMFLRTKEDGKKVVEGLLAGNPIVINLADAYGEDRQRIMDFVDGVCFCVDASTEKLSNELFMLVPNNVVFENEEKPVSEVEIP